MSQPKILWICSWFPNDEDQFRGDFIMRQAMALAGEIDFELFHFVAHARQTKTNHFKLTPRCTVTIGYNKAKNKLASLQAQWRFYNKSLKEYIQRNGKPDVVHLHIPWKAGLVVRYWLKKYGIPYIVSEHYGIYNHRVADNFFTKSKIVQGYNKKIFQSARRIITVSNSLGEEIKSIFKRDYHVIPNVVNTENFYYKNITARETFSFLHISNMYGIKNVDKIIEAFAAAHKQDNSLRLNLVGATPPAIHAQIEKLSCSQTINLSGEVPYEQVSTIMKEHHCFVLFSDWETQSCVALESLCTGRPVITNAVGGVQELVSPRNGLLVPAGNVGALSQAMLEVKKNYNQFHLEQIALDAQKKYSYEVVAKQLLQTYREVLSL